jgi:hypothetical protein
MPPDAPAVQRRETERCFYAALYSMRELLFELGERERSDESSALLLAAFFEEVEQRLARFVAEDAGGRPQ